MPFEIKGAPASGWYFPIGADASRREPRYWSGMAQLHGRYVNVFVITLRRSGQGPLLHSEWMREEFVQVLSREPATYERVDAPPATWFGMDIRATVSGVEEEVGKYRALIERLELEYKAR